MKDSTEPTTDARKKKLSAQSKRLVASIIVFGIIWVVFMQMTPRVVMDLPPAETPDSTPPFDVPAAAVPDAPTKSTSPEEQPATEPAVEIPEEQPVETEPTESAPVTLSDEKRAPETTDESEALKTLSAKLDALTAITQHASGENDSLRALRLKMEALEAEQKRTLMLLSAMDAYDRLKERALQGKPFTPELERLQRTVETDAALIAVTLPLAEISETGLPTLAVLQRDFSTATAPLLNPAAAENAGWMETLRHNMQQVVRIRKVGDVKGEDTAAILARAEAALEASDIDTAITEISALNSTDTTIRQWLINAKRYRERDRVLQDIKTALLSAHSATKEP